ncbi:MAG: antitermination protein NusG [Ferruginibacter sp.]|uniref:transcription termination/antitermination NusG family protein n=1 Tax=Ferruginibacter sp. TaxID=1940288 RepID=UPI00265B5A3A|nr:transcription termination/antitermination NusG family protein [Ferruginibacter sp.]MDB5280383.1 antitermination protein NusG [Ferruginibacter sp.]
MKKNWYAIYTRVNCELKVSAQLSRKKIENFCPVNNITSNTGFKRKWNVIPLFQSLLFVHVTELEMEVVKGTSDVLNFLYWLGAPAVISTAEIESIERFTNDYSGLKLERIRVNPLEDIQVISSSHKEMDLNKTTVNYTMVKMMLPSLGYAITANVKSSTSNVFDFVAANNQSNLVS